MPRGDSVLSWLPGRVAERSLRNVGALKGSSRHRSRCHACTEPSRSSALQGTTLLFDIATAAFSNPYCRSWSLGTSLHWPLFTPRHFALVVSDGVLIRGSFSCSFEARLGNARERNRRTSTSNENKYKKRKRFVCYLYNVVKKVKNILPKLSRRTFGFSSRRLPVECLSRSFRSLV